mgnify:CR=1
MLKTKRKTKKINKTKRKYSREEIYKDYLDYKFPILRTKQKIIDLKN